MFTGLIETKGKILEISKTAEGCIFTIEYFFPNNDLKTGDSICVNGTCLTVTEFDETKMKFYASYQTLKLTNLGKLEVNSFVNLERSMLPSSRMGGHIVSGHVDAVGTILERIEKDGGNTYQFFVEIPTEFSKYIATRGSVTVDGISLTVVSVEHNRFELVLIPETMKKTNASDWQKGSLVNLEIDLIARYVERLLEFSK